MISTHGKKESKRTILEGICAAFHGNPMAGIFDGSFGMDLLGRKTFIKHISFPFFPTCFIALLLQFALWCGWGFTFGVKFEAIERERCLETKSCFCIVFLQLSNSIV